MNDSTRLLDAWLPPGTAGRAISCLATTYAFDADFFEQECLARFLRIDTKQGEGHDLAYLIDKEERLTEAAVAVIADRGQAGEGRSLRWDVLPVSPPAGVQHAKVAVLVWEDAIRFIITSANLTPAGYRWNIEVAVTLDFLSHSEGFVGGADEILDFLNELVALYPNTLAPSGPRARVSGILADIRRRVEEVRPNDAPRRRTSEIRIASGRPGRSPLHVLNGMWRGVRPRRATVLSPFFDVGDRSVAADALAGLLARRGHAEMRIAVAVEEMPGGPIVRAPSMLAASVPNRIAVSLRQFVSPDPQEYRPLHAKAIVLESDDWVVGLVGSSNFTGPGLALQGANTELNIAIAAPPQSSEGRLLRRLIPTGAEIDLSSVAFEPRDDDETRSELPVGFQECLFDPAGERLVFALGENLPQVWTIDDPAGRVLVDSEAWKLGGRPARTGVDVDAAAPPFFVLARWGPSLERSCAWAVNVTDPNLLAPPEELRDLPVEALLAALASTRPLHEALSQELARHGVRTIDAVELDALQRHTTSGMLFQRTRRMSAALVGLRRRLERPAANIEALIWRLRGPFGPVAIATGFTSQALESGAIPGEARFRIAEIALTLSRVDWTSTARYLDERAVRSEASQVIAELRRLADSLPKERDRRLLAYVDDAFAEAAG